VLKEQVERGVEQFLMARFGLLAGGAPCPVVHGGGRMRHVGLATQSPSCVLARLTS
jgi:hypothetical protein